MTRLKHILVIRFSAMGDVAMTVPVIQTLVRENPEVKITVLSRPFLKPFFDGIENVSFFGADVDEKYNGLLGLYQLSKELNKLNIDAVADLHDVLRSKILRKFLSFGRIVSVIDKGRAEKKALTRTENKNFKQLKTTHERYADVFKGLGLKINLNNYIKPKVIVSKKVEEYVKIDENYLIGIAPFAQYQSKMYPLEMMEEVISELLKKIDCKILLFGGGKKEAELLSKIESKFSNLESVVGKFKLNEELELISGLDCMVSMDSANGHMSAMQGVKTISVWGVTHPYTGFYPFNQPMKFAVLPDLKKYPNIPCSIYGNKVCEGYEAVMHSILPETIVKTVVDSIKK